MSQGSEPNEYCKCNARQWSDWSPKAKIGAIIAGLVCVPVFLILFPLVTMQLWNWLMPALFKLPAIGFWQAVGLLLLSQILLKGSSFGRSGGSCWKKPKSRKPLVNVGDEVKAV